MCCLIKILIFCDRQICSQGGRAGARALIRNTFAGTVFRVTQIFPQQLTVCEKDDKNYYMHWGLSEPIDRLRAILYTYTRTHSRRLANLGEQSRRMTSRKLHAAVPFFPSALYIYLSSRVWFCSRRGSLNPLHKCIHPPITGVHDGQHITVLITACIA